MRVPSVEKPHAGFRASHDIAHEPQVSEDARSDSHPSPGSSLQSPNSPKHSSIAQSPPTQLVTPAVIVQALPHVPQSLRVSIAVSHPVAAVMSQSEKSGSQAESAHPDAPPQAPMP
jgi:hypothetical protein